DVHGRVVMKRVFATLVGLTLFAGVVAISQSLSQAGKDWVYPGGDQGGSRFSTLTQINTNNVTRLKRAWTFHTGSGRFASAPMVVDSVMYFSAPNGVYAVDAVTGTLIWKYPQQAPAPAPAAEPAPAPPAAGDRGGRGGGGRGGGGGGGRGGGSDSAGTA